MAKTKFFRCKVRMSHLRIAVFDDNGEPIIEEKQDLFKNKYMETLERTYKRGEEIILPEAVIKKLGKSVELVMAPVEAVPVEADPSEITEEEAPEGDFKEVAKGDTVAEKFPKPAEEKSAKGGRGSKAK
jgi:hypothetical protein